MGDHLYKAFKEVIPDVKRIMTPEIDGIGADDEGENKRDLFNKLRLSIATHETNFNISPGPS